MTIAKGTLVDIGVTILKAGERAPQVPEDTQKVDLTMRVKGILAADAREGDTVEIETPIGRKMTGILLAANPAYTHDFGAPIPELTPIGRELRELLAQEGEK